MNRVRRDIPDHGSLFNITRFVEMVIVNDYKVACVLSASEMLTVSDDGFLWLQYTKYGKNTETIFDRSKQIVNIVNSVSDNCPPFACFLANKPTGFSQQLYSSLNILVALVGVVIWTEKDEIIITSDSSQTLNSFLKYRRDTLIKMFPNDNAQLITGTSFESGIVGKALKQTLWFVTVFPGQAPY